MGIHSLCFNGLLNHDYDVWDWKRLFILWTNISLLSDLYDDVYGLIDGIEPKRTSRQILR